MSASIKQLHTFSWRLLTIDGFSVFSIQALFAGREKIKNSEYLTIGYINI